MNKKKKQSSDANTEKIVGDAIAMLPKLVYGLDVNVKFNG